MVRGRKRDVSAPLTRSLLLQRDYRARKAKYVSDLEAQCHYLEEENLRLLKEVESLQGQLHQTKAQSLASLTTEAEGRKAHALNEVLDSLSSAVTSIQAYQRITLGSHFSPHDPSRKSTDGSSRHTIHAPKPSSLLPLSHTPPTATLRLSSSEPPNSTSSRLADISNHAAATLGNEESSIEQGGPIQLYSPISNAGAGCSRSRSHSNATDLEHEYWETRPLSGGRNCSLVDNCRMLEDSEATHSHSRHRTYLPSTSRASCTGMSGVEPTHAHTPHTLYHREPLVMDYANDTPPIHVAALPSESLPKSVSSSGTLPMGMSSGVVMTDTRGLVSQSSVRSTATATANARGGVQPLFDHVQTYTGAPISVPPPSHANVFGHEVLDTTSYERIVPGSGSHNDIERTWS